MLEDLIPSNDALACLKLEELDSYINYCID